jgi:glucosamine--fructose-6-phosphate aminotransferase (isomerizing)
LAALLGRRHELHELIRPLSAHRPPGVILVARGSSDNAAMYGRYLLELCMGRPVALAAPSLFTLYNARVECRGWLAVALSQSGRTPEIVDVFGRLLDAGARGIAITNDGSSPLAELGEAVVELGAGEELAVPATKTFLAQLAAFVVVAEALGEVAFAERDLQALPEKIERLLGDQAPGQAAAQRLGSVDALVAVGRGFELAVALEAALKLKEAALLLAEGLSSADFRHGPIAVTARSVPVLSISGAGAAADDLSELDARLRASGVPLLHIAPDACAELPLPAGTPEALAPLLSTIRAQQLAREVALSRGLDPDAPPGLTKVTPTQ